jgi:predicted small secreted protein
MKGTLIMKHLLAMTCVLALFLLCTPGCNTVKGAGKDLQVVGEKGQELIDGERK